VKGQVGERGSCLKLYSAGDRSDIGRECEIFVADDQIFEARFNSCLAGLLKTPLRADSIPEIVAKAKPTVVEIVAADATGRREEGQVGQKRRTRIGEGYREYRVA